MLQQMKAGAGSGSGLSGLAGLPGMEGLGGLGAMEDQLGQAATAMGNIIRRLVLASLIGLVASTLASVGAAFIKKPLVPLTMSVTGGYCVAGAVEAGLLLTGLQLPAIVLQCITLVVVTAACVGGMRYQMRADVIAPKFKKKKDDDKMIHSPLSRVGPITGAAGEAADKPREMTPANRVSVDPRRPAPKGGEATPGNAKSADHKAA
jgi:hypothetical protein